MRYFWSPSVMGFFLDEVHGDKMPTDAQEISEVEWRARLARPMQLPVELPKLSIQQQLEELDRFLPRAVEDMWGALGGFDVRSLPLAARERFSKKQVLRRRRQGELAAG